MKEVLEQYQKLCDLFDQENPSETLCRNIHQAIQEIIDAIPSDSKIIIRPCSEHTEKLLESFDLSQKNIIGITSRRENTETYCGYPYISAAKLSAENIDFDVVLISSYYQHQEIKEELERDGIAYIDLYDILEEKNMNLLAPFYLYQPKEPMVLNYFYVRCLKNQENTPDFEHNLRTFLQIAVEQKDFVMIHKVYEEKGGENGKYPILVEAWKRTQRLLELISQKIRARKQKDIFLYWTDAVPYSLLEYMPEIQKIARKGCFFQQARTHTPYTGATLRAMFKGELPIDDFLHIDEEIDRDNSPLIDYLETAGYEIKCVIADRRHIKEQYIIDNPRWSSCCTTLWNGLEVLLRSEKPCFCLFHFLVETHIPTLSPNLQEPTDNMEKASERRTRQIQTSYGYLDQCLSFFYQVVGDKVQIFFSDHGTRPFSGIVWSEIMLHPYCFAVGEGIPQQTISRIFPYQNFWKFVRWIREPDRFLLDDICVDEVLFQDIDFYNSARIDYIINRGMQYVMYCISYRGIYGYTYKYVINALGKEFFYRITEDGKEILEELTDENLKAELQKKCGTEFLDIYKYDRFEHTRRLYKAIKAMPDTTGKLS